MANIFDSFKGFVENALAKSMERPPVSNPGLIPMAAQEDLQKRHYEDGSMGRKGMVVDPFFGQTGVHGLYKQKRGSMNNELLKIAVRANPIVSTIIGIRANETAAFCRKQNNHYDIGFKVKTIRADVPADPKEVEEIEDYLINCGIKENRHEDDKLTLDRWGYMITADFLRYGNCAIERDWTEGGRLYSFLPLPAESVYYADSFTPEAVYRQEASIWNNSYEMMLRDFEPMEQDDQDTENPVKYVQMIHGRDVANFTKKELIFWKFTDDNDIDLNGYVISPLEKAIRMIANQQKVENHQAMFFTHGMASRGILVIQGDVTENNLRTLQAQWSNQVAGSQNAWRTPVLGGIDGVQWVNLQPSNRDMEFAAYQDHLLRVIHACFMIDPEQTGFGYLSKGTEQKSLGESSNEWKVTASRDRGLRPILNRIEMIINEEVLPLYSKNLSEKYHFCFVGLDAETRMEETARIQGEVSLHTSLNEARKEAKKDPIPFGGNLILNPLLIQTLMQSMPFGVWVETFIGMEGASQRPDLQFFANASWFQWQTFSLQMMQMQAGAAAGGEGGGEKKPAKKSSSDKEGGQSDAQAQAEEEEARQAEIMQQASQQFIEANPQLFKSMRENLAKSQAMQAKIEPISKHMLQSYKRAGRHLIADIMDILKDDVIDTENRQKPSN